MVLRRGISITIASVVLEDGGKDLLQRLERDKIAIQIHLKVFHD